MQIYKLFCTDSNSYFNTINQVNNSSIPIIPNKAKIIAMQNLVKNSIRVKSILIRFMFFIFKIIMQI